jgi:hypothetical protein
MVQAPYVAYSNALKSRPLLTKACTSMVGFVLGDLIAQVRRDSAALGGTCDVIGQACGGCNSLQQMQVSDCYHNCKQHACSDWDEFVSAGSCIVCWHQ